MISFTSSCASMTAIDNVCPTLPDSQSLKKLLLVRLDSKLRQTMALIFDQEQLDCMDAASFRATCDTLNELMKSAGRTNRSVMEYVCGRYLLEELQKFFENPINGPETNSMSNLLQDPPLTTIDVFSNENRFNVDQDQDEEELEEDSDSQAADTNVATADDSDDIKRVKQGSQLYNKFALLLKACKHAAGFVDDHGLTLLHHLLLYYGDWSTGGLRALRNESCFHDLHRILYMLCRIVYMSFPSNGSVLAQTSQGLLTPFQILLMNQSYHPIDYELASIMLTNSPGLARMEDPNKRLPLHHMLNGLNYLSNTSQPYIVFLKQLLAAFPQSAFCHVSEEIRSIRIQPMTTTLVERTETINSTGNGERNYHFVTEKVTWTAIEKSRDYHHPQVSQVFDKFLEKMFWKRWQSQVRR